MASPTTLGPAAVTGPTGRSFAPITTNDGWLRCGHTRTALDLDDATVSLRWVSAGAAGAWDPTAPPVEAAGLAFDGNGCLLHGDPARGQIQRVAWRPSGAGGPGAASAAGAPVDLLAPPPDLASGGFTPVDTDPALTVRAAALAVDRDEHLFVLDATTGTVVVLDLGDGHVVRRIALPSPALDLAADGNTILVVVDDRTHPLVVVDALGLPRTLDLDHVARDAIGETPGDARPMRVAVGPAGERWLLLRSPAAAWAVPIDDDRRVRPIRVDGATDLELDGRSKLVVAGPAAAGTPPAAELRRFVITREGDAEDVPLRARGYDGRGIVRTPDGRIGFWNGGGFRVATDAPSVFAAEGHIDSYELDSGAYQQQWGRVFVEACIPAGASVEIGFVTADDEPDVLEPEGPSIVQGHPPLIADGEAGDLAAPPPNEPPLVAAGLEAVVARTYALHRRETGSELPWFRPDPGDRFEVYEAPVQAPPGRYLWLRLTLRGTTAVTPRVRAVRAEFPSHDLLQRLPSAFRRDPVAASFLRRYLAVADGLLSEMEVRAAQRDLLLDPFGAPTEVLPWLGSLIGLSLDQRWPEAARRTLLAEAICLFRMRGTIAGLQRLLTIYLDGPVVIVEAFRFRGTGGALGGDGDPQAAGAPGASPEGVANAIVGFGFRVGGEVGAATAQPLAGSTADAFETHAHRFSVIVPRDLDDEQLATVQDLLDLHRPAHTIVEVCAAGRGMRIGIGLHLGLSSVVGPSSGFRRAVVGETRLGTDAVIGTPRAGVRAGGSHLGTDTVVDP